MELVSCLGNQTTSTGQGPGCLRRSLQLPRPSGHCVPTDGSSGGYGIMYNWQQDSILVNEVGYSANYLHQGNPSFTLHVLPFRKIYMYFRTQVYFCAPSCSLYWLLPFWGTYTIALISSQRVKATLLHVQNVEGCYLLCSHHKEYGNCFYPGLHLPRLLLSIIYSTNLLDKKTTSSGDEKDLPFYHLL